LQAKLLEAKSTFENDEKIRVAENKMNKKKKVGISTISKSMSSLIRKLEVAQDANDIITPESSDLDSSDSDSPSPKSVHNEKISYGGELSIVIEEEKEEEKEENEAIVIDISNNSE